MIFFNKSGLGLKEILKKMLGDKNWPLFQKSTQALYSQYVDYLVMYNNFYL